MPSTVVSHVDCINCCFFVVCHWDFVLCLVVNDCSRFCWLLLLMVDVTWFLVVLGEGGGGSLPAYPPKS